MKQLICIGTCVLSLAAMSASAAQAVAFGSAPQASADIPSAAKKLNSNTAHSAGSSASSVSAADVGDADSFGRNLQWLGSSDMDVELASDCSVFDPSVACQTLAPAPGPTNFSFMDLGHISLPAKATNSLLCYWLSPSLSVSYTNPTVNTVVANLHVSPTLTVENPLLSTPGLIDATTGLPFGGSLLAGMTSSQTFQVPLPPGIHISERKRDSAVCIAGFLSRETLVDTYGLTESQAKDFFKKPTTVRLNLSGNAQYVDSASLYFGFRIIGD